MDRRPQVPAPPAVRFEALDMLARAFGWGTLSRGLWGNAQTGPHRRGTRAACRPRHWRRWAKRERRRARNMRAIPRWRG